MSTARFDPRPGEPYGSCVDCDATFPTSEEMSAHLRATFEDGGRVSGSGHTGRVTNQSRAERIRNHVGFAVDSAVFDFIEEMDRDIDREHFTAAEVEEALRTQPNFYDLWQEREDES